MLYQPASLYVFKWWSFQKSDLFWVNSLSMIRENGGELASGLGGGQARVEAARRHDDIWNFCYHVTDHKLSMLYLASRQTAQLQSPASEWCATAFLLCFPSMKSNMLPLSFAYTKTADSEKLSLSSSSLTTVPNMSFSSPIIGIVTCYQADIIRFISPTLQNPTWMGCVCLQAQALSHLLRLNGTPIPCFWKANILTFQWRFNNGWSVQSSTLIYRKERMTWFQLSLWAITTGNSKRKEL